MKDFCNLENKAALITGASRGIGKSIALALNKAGAKCSICANDETGIRETADALSGDNIFEVLDVTDTDKVEKYIDKTVNHFGKIDILVNNAGIYRPMKFHEISIDSFDKFYKVNLLSVFLFMKKIIPVMLENNWGRIINIASISGKVGRKFNGAYAASKHGVLGLTRVASAEYADKNITVNAICPGVVQTDIVDKTKSLSADLYGLTPEQMYDATVNAIPLKRLIEPDEVANLALFLSSEEASAITGQSYNISGGMIQY